MTAVSGVCTDASGAPAPGVFVYATPTGGGRFGNAPGTHTDRDGAWTLELPPGSWTVRETGGAVHEINVDAGDTQITSGSFDRPWGVPTKEDFERLLAPRDLPADQEN